MPCYRLNALNMKQKPLVAIYQRHQKKGVAIYLHYTVNGKQQREATGLRLTGEAATDKKIMAAAVIMQAERTAEIINGVSGLKLSNQQNKMLLTSWINETATAKDSENTHAQKHTFGTLKTHLQAFKPNARLIDVNKNFCRSFVEYLAAVGISQTTQKQYYNLFVIAINRAVKNGLLPTNEAALIEERPKARQNERVYLTESEIKALAATTETKIEAETKTAFLFSFLTGLRYSDITRLTPSNFERTKEGLKLKIETKKTGKFIAFLLPDNAAEMVADRVNGEGSIFKLKSLNIINGHLKALATRASISKNISFHTARHTFATMLLTKGADIYTVSTMLGHSSINTTAIYAKIVDKKKDETAKLLGGVL